MAIARDATTSASGSAGASPLTFAHTCTGTNLILWVATSVVVPNGVSISGVTYNSVAMTLAGTRRNPQANIEVSLWYLANPATGSNNVSITASGTDGSTVIRGVSASYTGCAQTGIPDAVGGGTGTGTSFSQAVTTVADNCWTVAAVYGNGTPAVSTGSSELGHQPATARLLMADSNSAITPAGSYTMNFTQSVDDNRGQQVASFAPLVTGPVNVKTVDGLAIASVKTVDGLAVASVKTINGLA